jgi:tetratricopeptide (TPR) repeat protein
MIDSQVLLPENTTANDNEAEATKKPSSLIVIKKSTLTIVLASLMAIVLLVGRMSGGSDQSSADATSAQQDDTSLVTQAVALLEGKQYEPALIMLEKAIKIDSNNSLAYYNQGVGYHFTNRIAEAEKSYSLSLAKNNADPSSYYNRGLARRDLGNFSGAISDLRIASVLTPEWAAAKYNLGQVLVSQGELSEGNKLIAEAKVISPTIGN